MEDVTIKEKELIHQWRNVFRYTTGAQLVLFDGTGAEYLGIIEQINPDFADVHILDKKVKEASAADTEGGKGQIFLAAALIKNDNFDWILQKATELGVSGILPVIAERTVKKNLNMERSVRIIHEAAEQSGRATIPTLEKPKSLTEVLEFFEEKYGDHKNENIIVCQGGKDAVTWNKKLLSKKSPTLFIVGPEGGWSPKELEFFDKKEYQKLSIGKNVLRAETAALALLALALGQ